MINYKKILIELIRHLQKRKAKTLYSKTLIKFYIQMIELIVKKIPILRVIQKNQKKTL